MAVQVYYVVTIDCPLTESIPFTLSQRAIAIAIHADKVHAHIVRMHRKVRCSSCKHIVQSV